MVLLAKQNDVPALTASPWPLDALSPFDVVAALLAALAPAWSVEREVDPIGNISIIVLPACDHPACTVFVRYEENGFVQVATVSGEAWQSRRVFPTCQRAVAAILAAIRSA